MNYQKLLDLVELLKDNIYSESRENYFFFYKYLENSLDPESDLYILDDLHMLAAALRECDACDLSYAISLYNAEAGEKLIEWCGESCA
ncbi:hypothetical protein [Alteribacter aurantiacus]|uniref:hypothetical protein n=1 Tax=Alteribacter aurantiacus TaxID=254410 RepID=UPI00041A7C76|nr:hypothetical protein [Alteribacter aurantiacus]